MKNMIFESTMAQHIFFHIWIERYPEKYTISIEVEMLK